MNPDSFLLIDDEPAIGALIRRAAESCGYRVFVTTDAVTFEQLFAMEDPGLIALDLAMPGADGIELLRRLADAGCQAKILIISGFDRRVVEAAFRLGDALGLKMAGTIPKPIGIAELRKLLSDLRRPA